MTPINSKLIHFPSDRTIGFVYESRQHSDADRKWTYVGPARGTVVLQMGRKVLLEIALLAARSPMVPVNVSNYLDPLLSLRNDDVDGLKLEGLGSQLTDAELRFIQQFDGLELLDLRGTAYAGEIDGSLARFRNLHELNLSGTLITNRTFARIGQIPFKREICLDVMSVTRVSSM